MAALVLKPYSFQFLSSSARSASHQKLCITLLGSGVGLRPAPLGLRGVGACINRSLAQALRNYHRFHGKSDRYLPDQKFLDLKSIRVV